MMVNPYDDSYLPLVLQVDHSQIAGLLAAHRGNDLFDSPRPYRLDEDPLLISFRGRLVPNRPYPSQEDFTRNFYKAKRITINYSLLAD